MIAREHKYLKLVFFIAIIYLIFLLIKPFISAILGSVILAYAFFPVHKRISLKIKNTHLAAGLSTLVVFLMPL